MATIAGQTTKGVPKTILVDDEGRLIPNDTYIEQSLSDILKEMKIMNLHLSVLTDLTIKKTEVE